jgi:hypothetical protein
MAVEPLRNKILYEVFLLKFGILNLFYDTILKVF